jgi:ribosome maturation factor RimP
MKNLEEIKSLVEEKLLYMHFYLYDMRFIRAGKRSMLQIFIDKPGGVTIDDCEKASNAISMFLDVEQFSDKPYTLEVSSPGLDRPLRSDKDFKMVIGHFLRVQVKNTEEGQPGTEYIGKLTGCENHVIILELEDETTKNVQLSDIVKAQVDVRFK